MARGKAKTTDEWRRFKKLETENEKLRKEVTKLRSIVKSSVLDHFEKKTKNIEEGKPAITLEIVCEVCGNEDVHRIPITRPDGSYELRACRSCDHVSPLKKVNKPKKIVT